MYASLSRVREYLRPSSTVEDGMLLRLIEAVSRVIDRQQGRVFEPELATIYHDVPLGRSLILRDDLLEVVQVLNGDGTEVTSAQYDLLFQGLYPKKRIRLKLDSDITWEQDSTSGESSEVIPVTGIWGFHDQYDSAWVDSLEDLGSDLSSDGILIPVSDSDGVDERWYTPRFQIGQLLKLSSGSQLEFLRVLDISDNVLTVRRGIRGTSAQAWAGGVSLLVWSTSIELAVSEFVRVLYHQSASNLSGIQEIVGTGVRVSPVGIPDHVLSLLPPAKVPL